MIDKKTEIQQSQNLAKQWTLNPTQATSTMTPAQENVQSIADYDSVMYTPREDSTKPIDKINTAMSSTGATSYSQWYESNNRKHLPGFELEGAMQLKADNIQNLESLYQDGQIGYADLLMESVGYDLLQAKENFRFNDPNFWYTRYLNNDYSDPRENAPLMSEYVTYAESFLAESRIGKFINHGGRFGDLLNETLGKYRSGDFATDETMSQFFGAAWEDAKKEFEGDVDNAVRSLRGHTALGRMSEDQTKYIHTDGRIYDVVTEEDEAFRGRGAVAAVRFNDDGSLDSVTINSNKLTGNILLDNTVAGTAGFMIDLGKVVSQVTAALIDVGEGVVTGDWEFDKVINTGIAFEQFKASNAITARSYIDLDGFEMNNFNDWMSATGDIAGLLLGMYLTAGIGGGMGAYGTAMQAGGGTIATGVGKTISFSGKLLSSVSNLHNGSATRGFASPIASRTAFAMTHASKDALSTYTYRKLAGANEGDAWRSAGAIFLMNSAITFAIGSGSKDDTYRMYRGMISSIGKRTKVSALRAFDFTKLGKFTDAATTAGLDFFDNYLTMSLASIAETTGEVGIDKIGQELGMLFSGQADFQKVMTSAVFASNAFRGVYNDYRTGTVSNRAIGSTQKAALAPIDKVIADPKSSPEDVSAMTAVRAEYDRILLRPETEGGGILNALEFLHQTTKKADNESVVSRTFAQAVKDFDLETYKEVGRVVTEYQEAHIRNAGSYFHRIMSDGFVRGTWGMLRENADVRTMNFKQMIENDAAILRQQSGAFERMSDPLEEAYRIYYGREMTAEELNEAPPLFEKNNLFNRKNFKYNNKNNTYTIKLEGKGILDGTMEFRTMEAILNRMADAGLITKNEDDKSGTVFEIPASMGKMAHAGQAIFDMYEGMVQLRRLTENSPIEDYISIANKIKNIIQHGQDAIKDDQPQLAISYIISAKKLGYVNENIVVNMMQRMFTDAELATMSLRNDEMGAYAEALRFKKKIDAGDTVTLEEAPKSGSDAEKIVVQIYPGLGKTIEQQVAAANARSEESPQSFASTLDTEISRGIEEALEVTFEANTILNPKNPLVNIFKERPGVFNSVKNEVRKQLLAAGVKQSEWTGKNTSVERRLELLRQMSTLDIEGYETFRQSVIDVLDQTRIYNLMYDTVTKDDITLKSETIQIRRGEILIDKSQFVPYELYKVYEMISQFKETATVIEGKDKESLIEFLQNKKVSISKLETQLNLWNKFLSEDKSNSRFLSVDSKYLKQFGYTAKEFENYHTSRYPGIINGNAYTKGFALDKKIKAKDLIVTIEAVPVQGVTRERYRIHAAGEELQGRFAITDNTRISAGEIGLLYGEISSNTKTGLGFINRFLTRMKAATLGGKGFVGEAEAIRGKYNTIKMDDNSLQLWYNRAMFDVLANFDEHPVRETKINYSPNNNGREEAYITKYWTLTERDGEYFVSDLKIDLIREELAQGKAVSFKQVLLLDNLPSEEYTSFDLLDKNLQRSVIPKNGSLYEQLAFLENDAAVRLIKDLVLNKEDRDAQAYDPTGYVLKSDRVGDIIADLETKSQTAAGLNTTELSLLRLLRHYRVDSLTTKEKLLMDFDLLRYSQEDPNRTVDDLILYIADRQSKPQELGEVNVFTKSYFDEEFNIVTDPRDLRNLEQIIYDYDLNDGTLRTTLEETMKELSQLEQSFSTNYKVVDSKRWTSLIFEIGDKQYIDYDSVFKADEEMIKDLKQNLSPNDLKKFNLFMSEMESIIGKTTDKDNLVYEWRAPLLSTSQPSLKETTDFLLRGIQDEGKLNELINRADAQLRYQNDRFNFNLFDKAFDKAFKEENKFKTIRETMSENMFNSMYRKYFDKDNPAVFQEIQNQGRYIFLDENGDVVYTAYGKTDLIDLATYSQEQLKNARYMVAADLYAKSFFEDFRMNIIDLNDMSGSMTYKQKLMDYGQYDILNWLATNRPTIRPVVENVNAYRKAYQKDKGSERGLMYAEYIDEVNNYIDTRLTNRKKIDNAITRFVTGSTDEPKTMEEKQLIRTFRNIIEKRFDDPTSSEATKDDLMFFSVLQVGNYDSRVENSQAQRILQAIVNGLDIDSLDNEAKTFINKKVAAYKKQYTKGIDKTILEDAELYIQQKIAALNESGKREPRVVAVPESLKQLEPEQLKGLIFAIGLEQDVDQGFNANTHKFLLSDNTAEGYSFEKSRQDKVNGLNFAFEDKFELSTKINYVLDIEAIPDDINNISQTFPMSVSIREVDFKNNTIGESKTYRFVLDKESSKQFYDRSLASMRNNRTDTTGLENDYKISTSGNIKDQTEELREFLLSAIKNNNVQIIAHNGAEFDFGKVLTKLYPELSENFKPGNKTFIDSIDVLRDITLKSEVNFNRSNIEAYRKNALQINKDDPILNKASDHSADGDTELLAKILTTFYERSKNGIKADHGKMYEEMESIYRSIVGDDKAEFDFNPKPNEIMALGYHKSAVDFFGLDKTLNKVIDFQQLKSYRDYLINKNHPYQLYRDNINKILKNYNVSERSEKLIENGAARNLGKMASYLLDNDDKTGALTNKFLKYVTEEGKFKKTKDILEDLLDPRTYTREAFDEMFGDDAEKIFNDFNKHTFNNNRALEKQQSEAMNVVVEQEPVKQHDYLFNQLFENLDKSLTFVEDSYKENIFQAIAESYRNRWVVNENIVDSFYENYKTLRPAELPLLKYVDNKNTVQRKSQLVHKEIFESLGARSSVQESQYGNARYMEYNREYAIEGIGTRKLQANEVGITKDTAVRLFGENYEATNLYGYILRYPSDRRNSLLPMKYVVVTDAGFKGNQFLIDDNVMLSLQGDFDGDKFSIFGNLNPNTNKALEFLNNKYLKPYVDIREAVESRGLIEGVQQETISRYYLQGVEHYEKQKANPQYLDGLFKDSTIDAKQIADFKDFIQGFDETKQTSIQIQKFLRQRSLINDQQKGMFQKSLTSKDMDKMLKQSEAFYADKENLLTRGGVRDVVITDHAVESLKNRGFTDKEISQLVMRTNNEMLKDISAKESNKQFSDLITAIDEDGTAKKTFDSAMRIANNFDDLNDQLLKLDTNKYFFASDGQVREELLTDVIKDLVQIEDSKLGVSERYETFQELLNTNRLRILILDDAEGAPVPPDTARVTSLFNDNYISNKAFGVRRESGFENSKELIQTQNLREAVVSDSFNDKSIRNHFINVLIGKTVVGSKMYFGDESKYDAKYFKTFKHHLTSAVESTNITQLRSSLGELKQMLDMSDPYFKETILKEAIFLNGIKRKKVSKTTKLKDLTKDQVLLKWAEDTYNQIDNVNDTRHVNIFETDFEYVRALGEMTRYISSLQASKRIPVYRGMPIFENFKTKQTRTAPSFGFVELTENGAVLITQDKISQEAIKLAAQGSAALKVMPFGDILENDDYHLVVSSANIKGSKLLPQQLKSLDVIGEKQEIVIDGKTYTGTVVESDVFPTENINSWRTMGEEAGSVIVENIGGKIDVTSLLSNMNSAMGRVLFNEGQLRQLSEFKEKYTPTPVTQRDMSPVMANLKFQLILSALTEQQRVELTKISAKEKIKYGNNIANRMDIYLPNAEKFLQDKKITNQMILNKLTDNLDMSTSTNRQYKRMIEGILEYKDYSTETVTGISGTEIEFTKGSQPKKQKEYLSTSVRRNDAEDAGSLVEVPGLKYMSYEDFSNQLGLYYDRYADQEAFELGYHTPGKYIALGVNSRFRNVNDIFANRINNEGGLNQIINSTKNGIVTKGMDNTYVLPNRGLSIGDETNNRLLPVSEDGKQVYQDIRANKYNPETNGKANKDKHLLTKAMDVAREMIYYNNVNNPLKFKQGIANRPISPVQTSDHLYTSLNFAPTKDGKLNYTGVLNAGEVTYNVNDPKVIKVSGSADFFEETKRSTRLEDIDLKRFTKPDTIIALDYQPISRTSNSFTEDFNVGLKEYNERLSKLDEGFARNEIDVIDEQTGEVVRTKMSVPTTPVSRNLFDIIRNTYTLKQSNYQNNLDLDFKKSWWRSQGIRYDSNEAFTIDSAIKRVKSRKAIIEQQFASRIAHLYDTIRRSGKTASEQFGQYYLFSKILLEIKEKQAVNPLLGYKDIVEGSYRQSIMDTFNVKTLDEAVVEMDNYVKGYNKTNGRITTELFNIQKDLLDGYRIVSNKTQNPIENGYAMLFPIVKDMSDIKDNGKSNFRTKRNIMFRPQKYDNPVDFLKLSDPKDLLTGMFRMASDIAELDSKLELSKELVSAGLIRSDEVMDLAGTYLSKAFDEISSKEGKNVSNQLLSKMLGKLYESIDKEDAEYIRSEYDKRQEGEQPSRHNIKQLYSITKNLINDTLLDLNARFNGEVESLEDIRSLIRSETDSNNLALLERAENTLSFIQEMYSVLIRNTDASNEFKNALVKEAGLKYNLVDKFGRIMDKEIISPLSESNFDHIEKSYRYQDNANYLSDALMGNLYFGNKKFTQILNDNMYSQKVDNKLKKAMRKTVNTFNRFTFGNPFRVLRRMENWTFTDMWMVTMANVKSPFFLGQSRKDLAQSYTSKGAAVTDKLKAFQQLSGTRPDTASQVDFFSKQTQLFDSPAQAKNFVSKVFDVSLEALTFQHQLPRYTLFLATLDDIEKTGNIQAWGAAYRFKDYIKSLPTKEEQAFRLMQLNIASFGDFPYAIKDIAPYLMLTSFTLGQARWSADWGMSMKEAALDVFKAMRAGAKDASKQDVSAAMRTLAYPTMVTGFGSAVGWLLLNFLADVFGADDETKDEWLDEGRYLEVIGTLINGSPTFTASKASPVDIPFDDWVGTGIKGYEGNDYGVGLAAKGGVTGAAAAYFNKHIVSRTNPLFKIPWESMTGRNYYGEFATDDRYSTNFFENLIRKSAGMIAGTGTVNAYLDNIKFSEYTNGERPFATAIFEGMKDSIASEFGNSRSFKKDIKDFYYSRSIIHNQLNAEGYYDREFYQPSGNELLYDPNRYDAEKSTELSTVFRSMMNRGENPSTLYSIIQAELNKGTTISTIHAALNRVSIVREVKKLKDPTEFIASLSEADQIRLRNGIRFENETFPGVSDINLYDLTGSRTTRAPYVHRPYYRQPFSTYKRYVPRLNYRSNVNFYNNMKTYHPYYEAKTIYDRWKPEEPEPQFKRNNRRNNRRR